MASQDRVHLKQIPSGVPNLDVVLGGGIPAYSINMVVGSPGAGKTTLVHQIFHHNASPDAKALYFVALGEPTVKLLRYQQQFAFFDPAKVDRSIFYFDLSSVVREQGLPGTLDFIAQKVKEHSPALLAIDSFKTMKDFGGQHGGDVRAFVHDLANMLAFWQTTSFLIGEYGQEDIGTLPEFSVADSVIWLAQEVHENVVVSKLRVVKVRGQAPQRGKHAYQISDQGVTVFPRIVSKGTYPQDLIGTSRVKLGVPGLDRMMHGGIPRGEATLVAGSSGTGKTLLSLHFIAEGIAHGEPGVMATFEEHPHEHERKAVGFGWNLKEWQQRGLLEMIYLRPVDLSADQVLYEVQESVTRRKAKRVVINSVSGFELGLAPSDRQDFRESLYRLVASLTSEGVTTLLTTEIPDLYGTLRVAQEGISFIADNLILLRYAEIQSQLRKVIMVVKMRTSGHDKDLRQFTIGDKGIEVEEPFDQYTGILSGIPTPTAAFGPQPYMAGLGDEERAAVRAVMALGQASAGQVAARLGVSDQQARSLLDKLADTGYVLRGGTRDKPTYRVALAMPGGLPLK